MDRTYYLFTSGKLKRDDNTLQLIASDGTKKSIPIETVYDIYNFADITVNSDLLEFLGSKGVNLHFFNYYQFYSGSFYAREKLVSGDLLIHQVEYYINEQKRANIARKFVKGAGENILHNLKYYNNRGRNFEKQICSIKELIIKLDVYNNVYEIMGIEGNIRKIYYSCWNGIVNQEIDFVKRVKRPPDNMINTLISFLNSVFYTKVLTEIYKTQLNPTVSYLHEPSTKRFSLSLDVSEIFKPLIIDRLIFNLLNKNIITEKDFKDEDSFLRMKDSSVKKIMQSIDDYLMTTIYHRTLKQNVSYRHLIRLELYKIIKHLVGDKEYDPFKIWW